MDSRWIKDRIKHLLLQKAKFERIHIVGCARSGTTMLYFALSGFQNTILYEREVSVWNWPGLRDTLSLITKKKDDDTSFIITKRNSTWYNEEKLNRLLNYVEHFNIGIIYLIRNPFDVLTSKHRLKPGQYYVDFDMWLNSINAGEFLKQKLHNSPRFLVVRYEDLILNISEVEKDFKSTFGLRLKPGVSSLSNLEEYIDASIRESKMVQYMHQLRNFDPKSINKWKHDAEKREYLKKFWDDPQKRKHLQRFMEEYGYESNPFEVEGKTI